MVQLMVAILQHLIESPWAAARVKKMLAPRVALVAAAAQGQRREVQAPQIKGTLAALAQLTIPPIGVVVVAAAQAELAQMDHRGAAAQAELVPRKLSVAHPLRMRRAVEARRIRLILHRRQARRIPEMAGGPVAELRMAVAQVALASSSFAI
jgi:hypothetical protein